MIPIVGVWVLPASLSLSFWVFAAFCSWSAQSRETLIYSTTTAALATLSVCLLYYMTAQLFVPL